MRTEESIPPALLEARRELEGVANLQMLGDFRWYPLVGRWALRARIGSAGGPNIEAETDWYVVVESSYPQGAIHVHVAVEGGVVRTFPHQEPVRPLDKRLPWGASHICVRLSDAALGHFAEVAEPIDARLRLRWYAERAVAWVHAAAQARLQQAGDPFELPAVPEPARPTIVFSEGQSDLAGWTPGTTGLVRVTPLAGSALLVASQFVTAGRTEVHAPALGTGVQELMTDDHELGAWIFLPGLPLLAPWHVPGTWDELVAAVRALGLDLHDLLRPLAPLLRPPASRRRKKRKHSPPARRWLLLGGAIPEAVGGAPRNAHWFALRLPALLADDADVPGFRASEELRWWWDCTRTLSGTRRLDWNAASNWHVDQLRTRGGVRQLRERSALVIGAGAVGSVVAEILVRGGVRDLTLVEHDHIEVGNLSRHTATFDEVGRQKVAVVGRRLELASPDVSVHTVDATYPVAGEWNAVARQTLVLDCTANDWVVQALADQDRDPATLFASISVGHGARRLYVYTAVGSRFPVDDFRDTIAPWLTLERAEMAAAGEPPRGFTGCWHPVFPAGPHDVWMMSAAAVKLIESVASGSGKLGLTVMEQVDEHGFSGLRVASSGDPATLAGPPVRSQAGDRDA